MKTHVGLHFRNAAGQDIKCLQLVNDNGKAAALADFTDGKLVRFEYAASIETEAKAWLEVLKGGGQ